MKKKILKGLWIAFIIYSCIGLAFYFLQDRILFHPVSLRHNQGYPLSERHKEIRIPMTETDTLQVIDFLTSDSARKGIILYFHGNKRNISWYEKYMPFFTGKGYDVLMIDYPGFGKSKGKLTEQKLYDWALQVYKLAIRQVSAENIIIYGKSMGTGIAAQLASVRDCRRLILETPYYDFPSVVQHYMPIYPVKWMLHYQLPTWQYLQNVTAPVTLLHGTTDWVVTYKNSLRLKKFLKGSDEMVTIKGGSHNNLFEYPLARHKLDSLLSISK